MKSLKSENEKPCIDLLQLKILQEMIKDCMICWDVLLIECITECKALTESLAYYLLDFC